MGSNKKQIIVVKLGTSVLTGGTNSLDRSKMLKLVQECAELHRCGHGVIVVTSGAVAAGREYLNYPDLPNKIASKQLFASVGQSQLLQLWEQLFSVYNIRIGQMLLTRADLEDKERFLNAQDVLKALLEHQIVPIINENDTVATAEIKVGDNDNLSALVAILAKADKLILLTDQLGLFTSDPRQDPNAILISEIDKIDEKLRALAGDSASGLGTGGMATKLQAAEMASRSGIEVIIAAGSRDNVIKDIIENNAVGTRFHPPKLPLCHRKQWLFGAPFAGKLFLDDGAASALIHSGCSLLPKGISRLEGNFSRGEVLLLCNSKGVHIAKGVSRYNSDALQLIIGYHSQDILSILGYEYGAVVVHRDDMIIN